MELRRPQLADKAAVLDMIEDFRASQSPTDGFFGGEDFVYEDWLEGLAMNEVGLGLPEGHVPSVQFVAFDQESSQALGFLNLRLALTAGLLVAGGHIGYSVRPSQQGKGYAKAMLEQGLVLAKSKNISRVLVTCDEDNATSRAVILANGGELEDLREGVERYWIGEKRNE